LQQRIAQFLAGPVQDGQEQVQFAGEVPVEDWLGDLGPLGDGVHEGAVVAEFHESALCGVQDHFLPLGSRKALFPTGLVVSHNLTTQYISIKALFVACTADPGRWDDHIGPATRNENASPSPLSVAYPRAPCRSFLQAPLAHGRGVLWAMYLRDGEEEGRARAGDGLDPHAASPTLHGPLDHGEPDAQAGGR